MSKRKQRKLKVVFNKMKPWKSRVIDIESGDLIMGFCSVDVCVSPDKLPFVTIILDQFDIEIEQDPEIP